MSNTKGSLTVSAMTSIVKRFAEHAGLNERYMAHSIRIGGATAAMKGGMTFEQIQAIGGWVSEAVRLYMRSVGMAELGASALMGFC